jgi:phage terminase large subunit-like protein
MLGSIVQHSFYDDEIAKARQNPEKMNEVICKLLNVYQGSRVCKWLTGDQIRQRQRDLRIDSCKYQDGWNIFVGLDFGGNDDLFAISYLGVNYRQDQPADERMFADCEAWIVEKALNDSPNKALYELWVEQGWLKVCPGEVFIPDYAINDLMAKNQQGLNLFMFGYDPAQSILPINTVKAWLQSLGIDAQTIKKMVVPVSQSFVTMNGLLQHLEYMLLGIEYNTETNGWSFSNYNPPLFLSNSPLWPWGFQNAKVEISSSELRAIRKTNQHTKIDMIHALLDACYVFDLSEGQIQQ